MDQAPEKIISVNEAWVGLSDSLKRNVCIDLFKYTRDNVGAFFEETVRSAHARNLELAANAQLEATGKRKLDDGDATDPAPALKRAKVSEAMAPPQVENIDIEAPQMPFKWPAFRQAPIKFGQPTLSSPRGGSVSSTRGPMFSARGGARGGKIPTVGSSSPTTLFGSSGNMQNSHTAFPTVSAPGLFSSPLSPSLFQFGNAKARTPAQPEPECDEQFTFFDRKSSQAPDQQNPSNQNRSSDQLPSPLFDNAPQGTNASQSVSAIYKPPFGGVDMSSLKIPANSNVTVTLNVFQAPSSLNQNTGIGMPRKLKCIHCNELFKEAQNTALQCRRHPGHLVAANDPKLVRHGVPFGAHHVWDCCRRTAQSQGCSPCNHYAG